MTNLGLGTEMRGYFLTFYHVRAEACIINRTYIYIYGLFDLIKSNPRGGGGGGGGGGEGLPMIGATFPFSPAFSSNNSCA